MMEKVARCDFSASSLLIGVRGVFSYLVLSKIVVLSRDSWYLVWNRLQNQADLGVV